MVRQILTLPTLAGRAVSQLPFWSSLSAPSLTLTSHCHNWKLVCFYFDLSDLRPECLGICSHRPTPQHRLSPVIRDSQMSTHTRELMGTQMAGPRPRVSDSVALEVVQKRCISNKFSHEATGDHLFKNPELHCCFLHGLVLK